MLGLALALLLPLPAPASAAEPPASLAAAVKAFVVEQGDEETPPFRHALADLDGDGRDDAVVLLTGPNWCGSGGCTMLVFRGAPAGFALVTRTTVTREPVRVSPEKAHGWRTLIVQTRDGDMLLRFNGSRYPSNPTTQPKATPAQVAAARTLID